MKLGEPPLITQLILASFETNEIDVFFVYSRNLKEYQLDVLDGKRFQDKTTTPEQAKQILEIYHRLGVEVCEELETPAKCSLLRHCVEFRPDLKIEKVVCLIW